MLLTPKKAPKKSPKKSPKKEPKKAPKKTSPKIVVKKTPQKSKSPKKSPKKIVAKPVFDEGELVHIWSMKFSDVVFGTDIIPNKELEVVPFSKTKKWRVDLYEKYKVDMLIAVDTKTNKLIIKFKKNMTKNAPTYLALMDTFYYIRY
jgi:hypothetical protein